MFIIIFCMLSCTGDFKEKTLKVVGNGVPHRPEVVVGDQQEERTYSALWKNQIASITPDKMVDTLRGEDGWRYRDHIAAGLSPWILKLVATTDNLPNRCVPGSLIEATVTAGWADPKEGAYSLAAPTLQPPYEVIGGPFGFSGQFKTTKGNWVVIASRSVLARVPVSGATGAMVLFAIGQTTAPDAAPGEKKEEYHLLIESPPRPDRETLLSYFAYVVSEAGEEKKNQDHRNRKESKYALRAIQLLELFAVQLDGEMQVLAKELLNHAAYKEAVQVIEEGAKKDQEAANKS